MKAHEVTQSWNSSVS